MEKTTDDDIKDFYKVITAKIMKDIHSNLRKTDPGLLTDFNEVYKETTLMIQVMREDFNVLSKRMKKIVDSGSLYEDVYKMRDELIEIKKLLEKHGK